MTTTATSPNAPGMTDMLDNATLANLNALKLLGFAEGLQEQKRQPELIAMSFDERLALLVDREMNHRSDRKRSRLLQRARLKVPTASIEDADFTDIRGLDRKTLTALALSGWIERGETILFGGATGVGKTWLACALGQYACRRGSSALYLRVPRLARGGAGPPRERCVPQVVGRTGPHRRADPR